MSAPPPIDRSGRAPLVPPGPFAPPVSSSASASGRARFNFLPDEPMKRPPPDQAARVFTASERTQAAVLAREDAMRHPTPSALERAVDDVKEGTAIGASIIAHAASTSAFRVRVRLVALRLVLARRVSAVLAVGAAGARRVLSAAAFAGRAFASVIAAGSRAAWLVTGRVVTGILLVALAVALGIAAVLVGLAGALRTGFALLLGTIASARTARPRASSAGIATARASEWSKNILTNTAHDLSRLRLTIRWHARSARPILGALSSAFAAQLAQSMREAPRRRAVAGFAVVGVVLIAAVYGAPRRGRVGSAPSPVPAATKPALASVAPAPAAADAAALVETLKERSAALLAPAAEAREAPPAATPAEAAAADREQPGPQRESMLGTLRIASAPNGAKVTIDGIPHGVSPVSVSRLRAGNRIVRLELDGYQRWSWAVYVSASRQTRLNVSLVPDSALPPSTAVTNTAAAAK